MIPASSNSFTVRLHRRNRDLVVDRDTAPVEFLDVRISTESASTPRDHPALLGHAHAGGGAAGLDAGIFYAQAGISVRAWSQGFDADRGSFATGRILRQVTPHQKCIQLLAAGC